MTIILKQLFVSRDRRIINHRLSCTTLILISRLESCIKQTQRFITRCSHKIHPFSTRSWKPNSLARSSLTSQTCIPSHSCSPQWPRSLDRIYWGCTQCIKVLTLITRRCSFLFFIPPSRDVEYWARLHYSLTIWNTKILTFNTFYISIWATYKLSVI